MMRDHSGDDEMNGTMNGTTTETMNNTLGNIYGYIRISTRRQSIERQRTNILKEYPEAIIFEEAFTGTTMKRKEWLKLIERVRPGDTIVFDSVSRMSCNADEGIEAYNDLYNRGIRLVFLKEPYVNTEIFEESKKDKIAMTGDDVDVILSAINTYMRRVAERQIRVAFDQAEKEVMDLRQRTAEGIREAKKKGKRIGTPKGSKLNVKQEKVFKEIILKHSKVFNGTLKDTEVMAIIDGMRKDGMKIGRNTYYNYKAELKRECQRACQLDECGNSSEDNSARREDDE